MSEKKIPDSQRSFISQFGEKNFGAGLKNFLALDLVSKAFPKFSRFYRRRPNLITSLSNFLIYFYFYPTP